MKGLLTFRTLNLLLIMALAILIAEPGILFPIFAAAAFCFIFIRKHVKQALALLSFVVFFLLPRYQVSYRRILSEDVLSEFRPAPGQFGSHDYALSLALQVLVALAFLGCVKLFWRRLQRPIESLCFILLFMTAIFEAWPPVAAWNPWIGFLFLTVFSLMARAALPLLFFRQANACAKLSFPDAIWVFPFWQFDIQNWDGRIPTEIDSAEPDQKLILRRILAMAVALLAIRLLRWLIFSKSALGMDDLNSTGIYLVTAHQRPVWLGWVTLFFLGLQYIVTSLWVATNLTVAFLNVIGLPVLEGFDRPWRAKSFTDALSRSFVYYSRLVTFLFYFPLYGKLRFMRRFRPFDQLLALFLSVFLFSMIYHCLRDYWTILSHEKSMPLQNNLSRYFLYSLFLSIAVCLSVSIERSPRWREGFSWIKIPLYFFVYCCLIFFVTFEHNSIELQLRNFSAMIGL